MALSCYLGDTFYGDSCYGLLLEPFVAWSPGSVASQEPLLLHLARKRRRADPAWKYAGPRDLVRRSLGR